VKAYYIATTNDDERWASSQNLVTLSLYELWQSIIHGSFEVNRLGYIFNSRIGTGPFAAVSENRY
jgi:hypothetical protein